nr:GGDEF domain-containing protein [Kineococcus aurantiacus]
MSLAVAGVVTSLVVHLRPGPPGGAVPPAVPPVPARTPVAVVVAGALAAQCVAPLLTAALTGYRLAAHGAAAPGPATAGAVGTGLVLTLVLAGLRARDGHRDQHAAGAARRDDLTGAWTRRGLAEVAGRVLAAEPAGLLPHPRPRPAAPEGWHVVLVDLDGFKAVNDTHGHAAGDEVLRVVAGRLAAVVEGHGVVARLGGDEFVLLVHGPDDTVGHLVRAVEPAVARPVAVGDAVAAVGSSTGVAPVEAGGLPVALRRADERMYARKRRRR